MGSFTTVQVSEHWYASKFLSLAGANAHLGRSKKHFFCGKIIHKWIHGWMHESTGERNKKNCVCQNKNHQDVNQLLHGALNSSEWLVEAMDDGKIDRKPPCSMVKIWKKTGSKILKQPKKSEDRDGWPSNLAVELSTLYKQCPGKPGTEVSNLKRL